MPALDQHGGNAIKTPGDIMDPNVVKVVLDFDEECD